MFSTENLLDQVIGPRALLAGVVVGLAACSAGGHAVGRTNIFKNFVRFQEQTDYRTNYLVGTNAVRSVLRETVRPDQIAVVVGGNSVLLGSGQGAEGVWTRRLQAELGDRYRVVNLALPGLCPQEFGTVAAEAFYAEGHRRVIVLTNQWLHPIAEVGEPDGRPIIQWLYRDAEARGLLLESPERAARLARPLTQRVDGDTDAGRRAELARLAALDSKLNFRDLWNGFEYECGVTVWCKPLAKTWTRARKTYPDRDPVREPSTPAFLDTLKPQMESLWAATRSYRNLVRRPSGELIPPAELGGPFPFEEGLRAAFPAPMRERLIMITTRSNPYFVDMHTADERITYDALGPAMAAIYARSGVTVVEVGRGYDLSDYYDHVHLSVAGGRRMAAEVAPVIRKRAETLGFLQEENP